MLAEIIIVVEVYTHSVSSKYTLDPIHRTMKSTGTPVERQENKTNVSETPLIH